MINIDEYDRETKELSAKESLERVVTLERIETSDVGTFGILKYRDFECYTGELPWRNNKISKSCIPTGEYICTPYSSKKYPKAFQVNSVPNRSAILIHQGNFCGDVTKGYKSDVNGCILLGSNLGVLNNQKCVIGSKITLNNFISKMGKHNFRLIIKDV